MISSLFELTWLKDSRVYDVYRLFNDILFISPTLANTKLLCSAEINREKRSYIITNLMHIKQTLNSEDEKLRL